VDETIVAIIVGLLSGALGSVLGPIATHFLGRREREEERDREIHAELRQMIEQRLDECGKQLGAAFRMWAEVRHLGSAPIDAYNRSVARRVDESRDQPRHRWEPYRITDDKLRGLAQELHERLHDLDSHLLSIASVEIDRWWAEVSDKEESLRGVERQARLRLDELRW
jgi:hypothetical protein